MRQGILAAIGKTPLIEMKRVVPGVRLFAKLEQSNPGGSTKDRPALCVIEHGLATGAIQPDTVVIESSSGNMGIGLAQVCLYHKLRFICVVDPKASPQNIRLLRAYQAEVDMVSIPDRATGEYLPARIQRVRELVEIFDRAFWPNQYANECNAMAHHRTMQEIVEGLEGGLDYLFCAVSTCGTLRGCAEYKKRHSLATRIIAVDAEGSVIFGGQKGKRLIPGHGAAIVPALFDASLADGCIHVTDAECVVGCHHLLQEEAILAGGSSGAIVAAIEQFRPHIQEGAVCVAILPDRGERYLDTIYSSLWVKQHFGNVLELNKLFSEADFYATEVRLPLAGAKEAEMKPKLRCRHMVALRG
jgi:2,3-diaminopropionate biosynthesis protein SbnA